VARQFGYAETFEQRDERLVREERKSAGFKGRREAGAVSRTSMGRKEVRNRRGPEPLRLVMYMREERPWYQSHRIIAAMQKRWSATILPCIRAVAARLRSAFPFACLRDQEIPKGGDPS
jgi:hypothetical protein